MKLRIFWLGVVISMVVGCNDNDPPIPTAEQLAIDIEIIKEYLQANNITATEDTTGVFYRINTLGTGRIPKLGECVEVAYTGRLLGQEATFDSSEGLKRPLTSFINGWQIAFPKIPQGSTATLYIPSVYAYGRTAQTDIPANSILQFDVELIQVYAYNSFGLYCYDDPLLLPEVQLQKDVEGITQYLAQQNITAQVHSSELRYTIQTLGTGEIPKDDQCVRIKYAGRLLGSTSNFDENTTGTKFPMSRLIEGLRTGLKLLPKGSKATFYIPSIQAYGPKGSGSRIPPNANIIFEVELVDVVGYNATAGTCN